MVRGEPSHEVRTDGRDASILLAEFRAALSGLSPAELQRQLGQMGIAALSGMDWFSPTPPPSRRRPRRPDVVTYRVRVDLRGTKPPLWRRLELASDLLLDDVHDVIQVALGWTDSHLHRFASGPDYLSHETEFYLCPFEVGEGEVGVPEGEVRLDEVLVETGDRLFYAYDFGDDWQHVVKLEAVLPRNEPAPLAVCVDGRRAGPPEDCGGIHGYELIAAATDPTNPDHVDAVAELADLYGDIDLAAYGTNPYDLDAINDELAELGLDGVRSATELPEPLEELLRAVRVATGRRKLRKLIGDAARDGPVLVDTESAVRMVRPYRWLLDRVGAEGIKLTSAGYLPPVHVAAAWAELSLSREWIGKGNREDKTLPILDLRESAQAMGLLRKHRGRLVLTPRGRAVRHDPAALWWHVAERLPHKSKDTSQVQAGLLLLIAVAAQSAEDPDATVAQFLNAIGWMSGDGTPITSGMAGGAAWGTAAVLRRMGAFGEDQRSYGPMRPTPDGVTLARAALRTWPD